MKWRPLITPCKYWSPEHAAPYRCCASKQNLSQSPHTFNWHPSQFALGYAYHLQLKATTSVTYGWESDILESLVAGVLFGGWLTLRIRIHYGMGCGYKQVWIESTTKQWMFPLTGQKTPPIVVSSTVQFPLTTPPQARKIARRDNLGEDLPMPSKSQCVTSVERQNLRVSKLSDRK